ncbi:MAG TPA: carboxymuconolactone decarboxylase family protein, partial [Alicycliphilus sp.]|nr:carboxymuconolactone decarboxylase family protein [Alicycliphilus sp.]
MDQTMYPASSADIARKRRELAPKQLEAFRQFSAAAFAEGELDARTKQLIAVAVAHVTQCPYCIRGHTEGALKAGASEAQIM